MKGKRLFNIVKRFCVLALVSACVDRIDFKIPPADPLMVVEGMITTDPGPYTVRVSKSIGLDSDSSFRDPIAAVKIKLHDDQGNQEDFKEVSPGVYSTSGLIQGAVGHSYYIHMETSDGKIFESQPDTLYPVGQVTAIKYSYQHEVISLNYGDVDHNFFNIFVDADAGSSSNNYVRWKFTGTYKVVTNPELHQTLSEEFWYKTPLPCSGYEVAPALHGGTLTKVGDCTCCVCWVTDNESTPHLSDEQLVTNHQFRNVKVGEAAVNANTFTEKYLVKVDQMSLSKAAFRFFGLIRAQREGASSLFQPPSGQVTGNLIPLNSNEKVVGLFWATSVTTKFASILRSDVPYILPPADSIPNTCRVYPNSTTEKPSFWQ